MVWLAAVADRGDAASRNPRRDDEEDGLVKIQLGDLERFTTDQLALARAEYMETGPERSNQAYGYVAKRA